MPALRDRVGIGENQSLGGKRSGPSAVQHGVVLQLAA
jgi:hypothetical protein